MGNFLLKTIHMKLLNDTPPPLTYHKHFFSLLQYELNLLSDRPIIPSNITLYLRVHRQVCIRPSTIRRVLELTKNILAFRIVQF